MPPDTRDQWSVIAESDQFKALLKSKARFVIPATIFFLTYYFLLPALVGYAPDLMKRPILGPLNIAYLFALSQFVMAWALAWLYLRKAAKFDRMAAEVLRLAGNQAQKE